MSRQQTLWRAAAVTGAMAILAGCGGSSSGGDERMMDDGRLTAAELAALTQRLTNDLDATAVTSAVDAPSGVVEYSGTMTLLDNEPMLTDGVVGVITMNANFGLGTFTAEADNFVNLNDGVADGSLSITNGTIAQGATVNLSGNMTGEVDFAIGAVDIDAEFLGFLYEDGRVVTGLLAGTAQTGGGAELDIVGSMIAEN